MEKQLELVGVLIESLESLSKMYRSLLDLVRKEKDLLVTVDLKGLDESNRVKEQQMQKIRLLEQARMKQARELARHVGADVEQPRLLDIATRVDDETAQRLRNLHGLLDMVLRRISEINKENEVLAQSALRNIGGAIESLRETLQDKVTYERKGEIHAQGVGAGQLIRKEV